MSSKILSFGSINIDYIYRVEHFVRPGETLASRSLDVALGGKGANQSVAIARAGGTVKHIGRASQSEAWVFTYLQACGVDISNVERVDEPSGHAIIQVDQQGENAIILHGGANQSFDIDYLSGLIANSQTADYLLAQNECNALPEVIAMALEAGLKVVLNPAPMTDSIRSLPLHRLDTLIVNEGEAQGLCDKSKIDDVVDTLRKLLPRTRVVITLGAEGAILIANGSVVKVPAVDTTVVDTTGAGDTFVGYFVAGLAAGLEDLPALERACQAAALSVQSLGAIASIPNLDQLTSTNLA
ncbi:MAG: ribokinase [Arenicella sp.]|jgi:ribokinase